MTNVVLLQWYLALMVAAFLLLGAEIYVPGGILGTLGILSLIGAVGVGFQMGTTTGWISVLIGMSFALGGVVFWFRVFPRSRTGRRLTLEADGRSFKAADGRAQSRWVGCRGVAQSVLRPAGVAMLDGRRMDVIAEYGQWIEVGTPIAVSRAVGGSLYVVLLAATEPMSSPSSSDGADGVQPTGQSDVSRV